MEPGLGRPIKQAIAECAARAAETERKKEAVGQVATLATEEAAAKKKYHCEVVQDPAWITAVDPLTQKPYYWHYITREARWKCPTVRVRKDGAEGQRRVEKRKAEGDGKRSNKRGTRGDNDTWDGSGDDPQQQHPQHPQQQLQQQPGPAETVQQRILTRDGMRVVRMTVEQQQVYLAKVRAFQQQRQQQKQPQQLQQQQQGSPHWFDDDCDL